MGILDGKNGLFAQIEKMSLERAMGLFKVVPIGERLVGKRQTRRISKKRLKRLVAKGGLTRSGSTIFVRSEDASDHTAAHALIRGTNRKLRRHWKGMTEGEREQALGTARMQAMGMSIAPIGALMYANAFAKRQPTVSL
jgi:hypothetical protein